MKNQRRRWLGAIAGIAVLAACFSTTVLAADGGAQSGPAMYATFVSLIPPVVAIGLALITKEQCFIFLKTDLYPC